MVNTKGRGKSCLAELSFKNLSTLKYLILSLSEIRGLAIPSTTQPQPIILGCNPNAWLFLSPKVQVTTDRTHLD